MAFLINCFGWMTAGAFWQMALLKVDGADVSFGKSKNWQHFFKDEICLKVDKTRNFLCTIWKLVLFILTLLSH